MSPQITSSSRAGDREAAAGGDGSGAVTYARAMAELLGPLSISLSRGDLTVTWPARQHLMARLLHVGTRARLRDSFQAAGSTRAAVLQAGQRATLLTVLRDWAADSGGGEQMPKELTLLQAALAHDLHPTQPSPAG